jgi:hypothetical protein
MTDELERFVAEALHGPGDDEEYDEAEDGDEYEADADDSGDADWPEGTTAREAWDSLDVEDQQAIASDPESAAQWRAALAGDDDEEEYDDDDDDTPANVASGPDVVKMVLTANPAEFEADTGITQEEWLVWASTCSAAEWAAQAGLVGWPPGVRPSRNDLPVEYRWDDEMSRRRALIAAGGDAAKRGYFE